VSFFQFSSIKFSPHENRILSLARTVYEKQVVCLKLFFVAARWLCSQSIFFRPYNITVIAVSDFSFMKKIMTLNMYL
jgi:hypothetical protein